MNASDLDLNALSHALDDSDPDREHFLDLESASLWTFVFSEATDEARATYESARTGTARWRAVPSRTPRETFEEIEDFVESLPEGAVQEAFFRALERRGAFRNFREALMEHPEIRAQWLAVGKQRSRERLSEFLESLGIPRQNGSTPLAIPVPVEVPVPAPAPVESPAQVESPAPAPVALAS